MAQATVTSEYSTVEGLKMYTRRYSEKCKSIAMNVRTFCNACTSSSISSLDRQDVSPFQKLRHNSSSDALFSLMELNRVVTPVNTPAAA